jgi:hypothetical protein
VFEPAAEPLWRGGQHAVDLAGRTSLPRLLGFI